MAASILRWRGGSGGDMILYFKSISLPGSVVNVDFCRIDNTGKTNIDFSKFAQSPPREIDKIALTPEWIDLVNLEKLSEEIIKYHNISDHVWIKSHYYNTDQFDNITVDLIADPLSLPFVVLSNVIKTDTVDRKFNNLSEIITNPAIKINYSLYSVAVDNANNCTSNSCQQLLVSDLLISAETFKNATDRVNLQLDFKFSKIYNYWLATNQPYIPSEQYQKKILNCDYDFMDTGLTKAERYSLMALARNKFINLC
jgi:hypothetical protein